MASPGPAASSRRHPVPPPRRGGLWCSRRRGAAALRGAPACLLLLGPLLWSASLARRAALPGAPEALLAFLCRATAAATAPGTSAAAAPALLGGRSRSPRGGAAARTSAAAKIGEVNEEEWVDVYDQDLDELALDVRELLITDANLFFIGPDTETYEPALREVAGLLNYTWRPWSFGDLINATEVVDVMEHVFVVPPLVGVQRWPWAVMRHGLVIWLDPDGYEHLNAIERDRIRKLKFPKKKAAFGPGKPPELSLNTPSEEAPGDPIDMWQEADVHVDFRSREETPATKVMLASIINAILDNPPKWRGWMKQAKIKGSVPADYQTPLEQRREYHSYGISPRLNRLLKA